MHNLITKKQYSFTLILCVFYLCCGLSHSLYADTIETIHIDYQLSCHNEQALMVLPISKIPKLDKQAIKQISLYKWQNKRWQQIPHQLDSKDNQQRYIVEEEQLNETNNVSLNDELVIRKRDLGERYTQGLDSIKQHKQPVLQQIQKERLLEIAINDTDNSSTQWFYIAINELSAQDETNNLWHYDAEHDQVTGPVYQLGFNPAKPFLAQSFKLRDSSTMQPQKGWSKNLIDTMKIRHYGKFIGIPFERTDEDYDSQLVAVKEGPLRIIRRTHNRVRVLWYLKTPSMTIDYVIMPEQFVMDIMIDLPFKLSLIFSELETITTTDWQNNAEYHTALIPGDKIDLKATITGQPSPLKEYFNLIEGNQFSIEHSLGLFNIALTIPEELPVQSFLYLKDDLTLIDLPENQPGQFGNSGFRTIGWEKIDNQLHHLKMTACIAQP